MNNFVNWDFLYAKKKTTPQVMTRKKYIMKWGSSMYFNSGDFNSSN